jgi:hypothetical protein
MTEHAPDRLWSGIDIPKTIAGALAAVCAAVIGSFLGVAGTLIGAAVASVIGSVGTEVYHRSLQKGTKKLHTTLAPTFVKAPAAVGTPEVAAATEDDSPSHIVPPAVPGTIRWGRVAAIAGALFVLAMGSLTVAELFTGKSVASTVGNTSSTGTTVGSVFDGDDSSTPPPAPSKSPAEEQSTPSEDQTSEPTEAPATTEPAERATDPATVAPTTEAPQSTPTVAPQQQDGQQGAGGAAANTGSDPE